MTRKTFNQGLAMLFNAFTYAQERTTPETEEVYWHVLKHIPDAKFNEGVIKCLMDCKFFPAIAEIIEAIYPPYEKLPKYNPYGNGKMIKVTPVQQLAAVNREAQIGLEAKTTDSIEDKRKKVG